MAASLIDAVWKRRHLTFNGRLQAQPMTRPSFACVPGVGLMLSPVHRKLSGTCMPGL